MTFQLEAAAISHSLVSISATEMVDLFRKHNHFILYSIFRWKFIDICQFEDFGWQFELRVAYWICALSERLDAMPRICNWPFCLVSIVLFIAFSFIFIRNLILVVQLSIFRRKILRFKVTGNKLGELLANEQIPFLISSCFCLFQRQSVRAALLLLLCCCCCALPFPQLVSGKRKLTTFSPSYLHNQFRAFVMRQKANGKCWAHDRICCCFLPLAFALSLSSLSFSHYL